MGDTENVAAFIAGQPWRQAARQDYRPVMDLLIIDRYLETKEVPFVGKLLGYLCSASTVYIDPQVDGNPVPGTFTQGHAWADWKVDRDGTRTGIEIHQLLVSGNGLTATWAVASAGGNYTLTSLYHKSQSVVAAVIAALTKATVNNVGHPAYDQDTGLWHANIHSAFKDQTVDQWFYSLVEQANHMYQDEVDNKQRYQVLYRYVWTFRYGYGQEEGMRQYQALGPITLAHTGLASYFHRLGKNEFEYMAILNVRRTATPISESAETDYS